MPPKLSPAPLPPLCCIVGVDTDVGKTVATAALLRAAARLGLKPHGIKAVQTGLPTDAPQLADAARYVLAAPDAQASTLEAFAKPCSPHLAAALENRHLSAHSLASRLRAMAANTGADWVAIEGAGGWLAPIGEAETMADVVAALQAPVVLVAANRVGVLNHALLTLQAIGARGVEVAALLLNQAAPPADAAIALDNLHTLQRLAGIPVLALPHCPEFSEAAWESLAQCLLPLVRALAAPVPFAAAVPTAATPVPLATPVPPAAATPVPTAAPTPVSTAATTPVPLATPVPPTTPTPPTPTPVLDLDRAHVWHPYAGIGTRAPVWEAARTEGVHIFLADGRRLLDGVASWWAAIHGYNHPRLVEALHRQATRMPHVMFGGLTHAPAARLAHRLCSLAPEGLSRVFFADSGSVAVEVALKMAVQCQRARQKPQRRKLLAVRGGYHGDTLGAMSVGDPEEGMHHLFSGLLPQHLFLPRPPCRFDAPFDSHSLDAVAETLERHGGEIAAAIVEPIAQCAGGMWLYHPEWLRGLAELCRAHGVLLIADEIATGFGRTGKMFACNWADVHPDIGCIGKALTGGHMSLAATLCTEAVAVDISANGGALMHGPTFMANPLACAVAHASLELLAEGLWAQHVARIEARLKAGLERLRGMPGVVDVRVLGAIGAVEMAAPVNVARLQTFWIEAWGVWLRPFERLLYLMPPYVVGDAELEHMLGAIHAAIKEGQWTA